MTQAKSCWRAVLILVTCLIAVAVTQLPSQPAGPLSHTCCSPGLLWSLSCFQVGPPSSGSTWSEKAVLRNASHHSQCLSVSYVIYYPEQGPLTAAVAERHIPHTHGSVLRQCVLVVFASQSKGCAVALPESIVDLPPHIRTPARCMNSPKET